jgi:hypothetical protein
LVVAGHFHPHDRRQGSFAIFHCPPFSNTCFFNV